EAYDSPMPSGNSVAASNILRLAEFTGKEKLRTIAKNVFQTFHEQLVEEAPGHTQMLCAVDFYLESPIQIVFSSNGNVSNIRDFVKETNRYFLPNKVTASTHHGVSDEKLLEQIPLLKGKKAIQGKPTVYICREFSCEKPITEISVLRKELSSLSILEG
ncbi:MAG: hypothetical protein ABIH76_05290, partial [Candidatus Bathyarchaeota archaeon]